MVVGRRRWRNFPVLLCSLVLLSVPALATPAEEINRAVAANGVSNVSQARPRQFLKAFTAVALRTSPRELPDYVIAAINLRPDLAPNIAAAAIKAGVKTWEDKPETLCPIVERIIRSAIAARPEATVSIARAGTGAASELRRCITSAALAAAPNEKDSILQAANRPALPFAFLTVAATEGSGFSYTPPTLSPANISDLGEDSEVTSPEQPPAP